MPLIEPQPFLTPPVVCMVQIPSELSSKGLSKPDQTEKWQALIDRLVEWGLMPGQFDDDGLQSPTKAAVSKAFVLIQELRESKRPMPHRFIEDGDGGIVIERQGGTITERFEVAASGDVEFLFFRDCRLIERRRVEL